MSALHQLTTNAEGFTVKVTAPKPVTDAAERFNARCIEEDHGYSSPCLVWQGSVNFNLGADLSGNARIVNFRRAAFEIAGRMLSGYTRFNSLCKTPRCCRLDHISVINIQG